MIAIRAAASEARAHIFGRGFDRGFKLLLAVAALAFAILLWRRAGPPGVEGLLAGIVGSAIYLSAAFVVPFVYMFGVALLAPRLVEHEAIDPPMRAVVAAFVLTVVIVSTLAWAASHIPLVGGQLRALFA